MPVHTASKIPFYIRVSILLVGICALGFILFIGRDVLLPLAYSFLFAVLVHSPVRWLERIGVPRILAITIGVVAFLLVMMGVIYFITSEMASFSASLPKFKQKGAIMLDHAENWLASEFHTDISRIKQQVDKLSESSFSNSSVIIGHTLSTVTSMVVTMILIPVYVFMILYYQPLLLVFVTKVFNKNNHEMVGEIIVKGKSMIKSYLVGLMVEALIIATLNSAALLILGVEYAILLGIIGALLNVIPFIGGILAVILPMLIAVITKDSFVTPLLVLIVYMVIQFTDNHFIVPKIVASRVRVNALVSVVVVLLAGALWGIAGMFLAIPLTAIIKIIFDRIEPLKPWGFLLGDEMPDGSEFFSLFRKIKPVKKD